ncbi:hypothetical protein EHP00_1976 [Ecytonucleospora hepatopenaei]|uniref:Uncharacterized protein n=1 Tax=Ecytonucleospora hepatopenaei TaxID=646526 RepID=A0A1W0E958_9MICR|nr:hypothetical protein EHP00_1976 [Ecytonucleospora hepatopenaei]
MLFLYFIFIFSFSIKIYTVNNNDYISIRNDANMRLQFLFKNEEHAGNLITLSISDIKRNWFAFRDTKYLLEIDGLKFILTFSINRVFSVEEGLEFEDMEDIEVALINAGLGLKIRRETEEE